METAAIAVPMISSLASAGASVAGGLQSGAAGAANRQIAEYQAQRLEQNAQMERDMAAADAADMRVENRKGLGSIRAQAGASGLVVEDGSPLEALMDSAAAGELNVQRRLWQGEVKARGLLTDANAARVGGILAQERGNSAQTAGFIQGGSSLLTAGSQAGKLFKHLGKD